MTCRPRTGPPRRASWLPSPARGAPQRSSWPLATAGALVAVACLLAGSALEGLRFGWSDRAATARVEREVRRRLDEMTASLSRVAAAVADRSDLVRAVVDDPEAARRLFDLLADTTARMAPEQAAATIYDPAGIARA